MAAWTLRLADGVADAVQLEGAVAGRRTLRLAVEQGVDVGDPAVDRAGAQGLEGLGRSARCRSRSRPAARAAPAVAPVSSWRKVATRPLPDGRTRSS